MTRKVVINGLLGGMVGFVLAHYGITIFTGAWWMVFVCIAAMLANQGIDG